MISYILLIKLRSLKSALHVRFFILKEGYHKKVERSVRYFFEIPGRVSISLGFFQCQNESILAKGYREHLRLCFTAFNIFIFRPNLNMEQKSSTQSVRFLTFTCQLHDFAKLHDTEFEISIKF